MPDILSPAPRRLRRTRLATAVVASPLTPAPAPPRRFPSSLVLVPNMEPLVTSFGVELEMRPIGWTVSQQQLQHLQNTTARSPLGASNISAATARDQWWHGFVRRLLDGGFIDPAKEELFRTFLTNPYGFIPIRPWGSPFSNPGGSSFWRMFAPFLHPEIIADISDVSDSPDAGGDELKSPILTTAEATLRFFKALYGVVPHIYDLRDIHGCGMHIHVGHGDAAQTQTFERFMISREWAFQVMVPQYRRHGYNRVWRTDTLMALVARRAMANSSTHYHPHGLAISGASGHNTFDGDLQSFYEADVVTPRNPHGSPTLPVLPEHLRDLVIGGYDAQVFESPLRSTHGHWICGGRFGTTTEFRLFAPPPNAEDVVNWIRLLNHLWKHCRDNQAAARTRSNITPAMTSSVAVATLIRESGDVPSDLRAWMLSQTQYHGASS